MKILHTADLHLGRQFNGISLDEDHGVILDRIVAVLVSSRADVLVIAGDVFDRAAPPASAVALFNAFLSRVARESAAAVVTIAGNHDSGERIAAMAVMADTRRALIRGDVSAQEMPLVLNDAHGPVAFSALPFAYEYAAREAFGDETLNTPQDVLAAQVGAARGQVPPGARWVVVAHAFVAGALGSEGERPLARVGGIETVSPDIFDGAQYVALGHLHRPQCAGAPHIRYSGSPLAFGFDEAGGEKSMSLVDLDADGGVTVEEIPFVPPRAVRVLHGLHADLLKGEPSGDFVKAVLSDTDPVIDAMKRLRAVHPHACEMSYTRDERAPETKAMTTAAPEMRAASPLDVASGFLEQMRGTPPTGAEHDILVTALDDIRHGEDAA